MEKKEREQKNLEAAAQLMRTHKIAPSDIMYITHANESMTCVHLLGGKEVTTRIPMKHLRAVLPAEGFWCIQKGILVSRQYVVDIEGKGLYTMADGRQFMGRGRNPAEHKRRKKLLTMPVLDPASPNYAPPMELLEKCTLMDEASVPFCVTELVFADDGRGLDFVFRYCNKAMEPLEGRSVEEMIGHSFYEVFKTGDKRWVVPCADTAINGVPHVLLDYQSGSGKTVDIRCFQPQKGYCGCLIIEK